MAVQFVLVQEMQQEVLSEGSGESLQGPIP